MLIEGLESMVSKVVKEVVAEDVGQLLERIRAIWRSSRQKAMRSLNSAHVCANWLIGQQIVQAEQGGAARAGDGLSVLKRLSSKLSAELGGGFSLSALKHMRSFFLAYPNLLPSDGKAIGHALRDLSEMADRSGWRPGRLHDALGWTHDRSLLRIGRHEARDFYEIEAAKNGWSSRQLDRQTASMLFERLAKSRDLKVGKLDHADLGQMQLYVNSVLAEKSRQIFASRYQLYLPTEAELQEELLRELAIAAPESAS